jgi:NADPH-dependent 7-cyano-7-deazaguanine reductase QueF
MIAKHAFNIHAKCPMVAHDQWDYYTVTIQTEDTIDVHYLESVMDSVRGMRATQEQIAELIKQQLSCEAMVEVTGRHSQNSTTTVYA